MTTKNTLYCLFCGKKPARGAQADCRADRASSAMSASNARMDIGREENEVLAGEVARRRSPTPKWICSRSRVIT